MSRAVVDGIYYICWVLFKCRKPIRNEANQNPLTDIKHSKAIINQTYHMYEQTPTNRITDGQTNEQTSRHMFA